MFPLDYRNYFFNWVYYVKHEFMGVRVNIDLKFKQKAANISVEENGKSVRAKVNSLVQNTPE